MSVTFQLGHNDHKTVEDFLLRRPAGVGAIVLHAKSARWQQGAAEAAQAAGVAVLFNPATERLTAAGYQMPKAPYFAQAPYDVDALAKEPAARARLVDEVISGHPDFATAVTPAHFYVNSERSANLNVVLAADTRNSTDRAMRAVLVLDRRFGVKHAADLAGSYAQAGIDRLELRLSPFGGEDESLAKIKSAFAVLDAFRDAGVGLTLGWSGTIGSTAVAFGHAAAYSVGVGMLEQVNHSCAIATQRRPVQLDENGKKKSGGPVDGVYLAGICQTVSKKIAQVLLGHTDIRLRLGCRLEGCGSSVDGPATDPRRHYLHARAQEMDDLLRAPAAWRGTTQTERLTAALNLRDLINTHYGNDIPALKTRTLHSILDLGDAAPAARIA